MKQSHTVDQIISTLRKADVELGRGKKAPEVCKAKKYVRSELTNVAVFLRPDPKIAELFGPGAWSPNVSR